MTAVTALGFQGPDSQHRGSAHEEQPGSAGAAVTLQPHWGHLRACALDRAWRGPCWRRGANTSRWTGEGPGSPGSGRLASVSQMNPQMMEAQLLPSRPSVPRPLVCATEAIACPRRPPDQKVEASLSRQRAAHAVCPGGRRGSKGLLRRSLGAVLVEGQRGGDSTAIWLITPHLSSSSQASRRFQRPL